MFPSGEHFYAAQRAFFTIHDRLIKRHDLIAVNGSAQGFIRGRAFIEVPVKDVTGGTGDQQQKKQHYAGASEQFLQVEERRGVKLNPVATMELCILAFGFALMVGIPVGMLAGITRNKWQDKLISALALLGFSVPVFWLALLLTLFFSLTLGWLPVSGRFDLLYNVKTVTGFAIIDAWLSDSMWRHEMIVSAVRHMVLPVLTLAVAPTTEVIRLMRISTIEVFDQNYVKAAATRGLSRLTILRRHVLHNALPPVIPRLGLQFSTMLTLAMITEMVFSWPGLGRWLINAIRQQDYAAISAGVMVIGALVIIVNVISDILGAMANPLKHKEWYALR
jgi:cationic peptide transport system permease protein